MLEPDSLEKCDMRVPIRACCRFSKGLRALQMKQEDFTGSTLPETGFLKQLNHAVRCLLTIIGGVRAEYIHVVHRAARFDEVAFSRGSPRLHCPGLLRSSIAAVRR